MFSVILVAMLAGIPQANSLNQQQCDLIIAACTGTGGPVPMYSPPRQSPYQYRREECRDAAEAAEALKYAAQDLAQCAARQDFGEDCSRQARAARYAADDYGDKTSSISGECE